MTAVEDLRPNCNLAMGTLTLDLRDVEGLPGANQVAASVGMGEWSSASPPARQLKSTPEPVSAK